MMNKSILLLFLSLLILSCSQEETFELRPILMSQDGIIKEVIAQAAVHELQIKCSLIKRSEDGMPYFIEAAFRVDDNNYHYPASTVKMPVAFLALEKTNQLENINLDTPYNLGADTVTHTLRKDIEEIFIVSANAPYNRLLAFLGYEHINSRLSEIGLHNTLISHKLSESGISKNKFDTLHFLTNKGRESIHNVFKPRDDFDQHKKAGLLKGIGYTKNDSPIEGSFDFSRRNLYSVNDIHNTIKRIYFPEAFSNEKLFQLTEQQLAFLKKAMSTLPKEMGYDSSEYYDSYGKFLMFGDSKDSIPDHIKVHNKVGYAYGTLTDCAYFVDKKNNVEFILSATILVNDNQIFNDGNYEYDEIGIPFLAELGRVIHGEIIR